MGAVEARRTLMPLPGADGCPRRALGAEPRNLYFLGVGVEFRAFYLESITGSSLSTGCPVVAKTLILLWRNRQNR